MEDQGINFAERELLWSSHFQVMGVLTITLGAYYSQVSNVAKFIATFVPGAEGYHVEGIIDVNTANLIRALCIVLIATGIGITIVSSVGFAGAIMRSNHLMLGVSHCMLGMSQCIRGKSLNVRSESLRVRNKLFPVSDESSPVRNRSLHVRDESLHVRSE